MEQAANRDWLLTEGYKNGQGYELSALRAAVLGRMIEPLRQPELPLADLIHHAKALDLMSLEFNIDARNSIYAYADGPEAVGRLFDHVEQIERWPDELAKSMLWIAWFLEDGDIEDADADNDYTQRYWPRQIVTELATRLAALLDRPEVDTSGYFWRDRPSTPGQ